MCREAQEAGVPHRGYIDRKKENVIFTLLHLGDLLSDWNQICNRVACQPGESTYQEIAPAISEIQTTEVSIFFFIFFGRLYRAGTGYTVLPAILPAVEGIILRMLRAFKKKLVQKT